MRNNRVIFGGPMRPIFCRKDRMIVSTHIGGELMTRDRRRKCRELLEVESSDDQA